MEGRQDAPSESLPPAWSCLAPDPPVPPECEHVVRSCNRASLFLARATTATTYDAGDRPTQITDSVGGTMMRAYENGTRRFSGGSRSAGT